MFGATAAQATLLDDYFWGIKHEPPNLNWFLLYPDSTPGNGSLPLSFTGDTYGLNWGLEEDGYPAAEVGKTVRIRNHG